MRLDFRYNQGLLEIPSDSVLREVIEMYSILAIAATLTVITNVLAADTVFSGPQVGEKLPPFIMTGVHGEQAGAKIDVVSQAKGDPLLIIFFHERTRPAFGLMNAITRYAATRKKDKLTVGVCMLTDDPTSEEAWMKGVSRHLTEGVTYGISTDGVEGPGAYGLNRNVALSILIGKENRVTANFALVQPSIQADGPKILQELVNVLGGGPAPDIADYGPQRYMDAPRMRRDPKLAQLLRSLRNADSQGIQKSIADIEAYIKDKPGAQRLLGQTAARLARTSELSNERVAATIHQWAKKYGRRARQNQSDNTQQDPKLRPLLAPLIRKNATAADVDKAAKEVEDYIAKHEKAKQQVGQISRRIVNSGRLATYGTPTAQAYLRKWAKEYGDETDTPSSQKEARDSK